MLKVVRVAKDWVVQVELLVILEILDNKDFRVMRELEIPEILDMQTQEILVFLVDLVVVAVEEKVVVEEEDLHILLPIQAHHHNQDQSVEQVEVMVVTQIVVEMGE